MTPEIWLLCIMLTATECTLPIENSHAEVSFSTRNECESVSRSINDKLVGHSKTRCFRLASVVELGKEQP